MEKGTESLFSALFIEFDAETSREEIVEFTVALAKSVRDGAKQKGVVGVSAQGPEINKPEAKVNA